MKSSRTFLILSNKHENLTRRKCSNGGVCHERLLRRLIDSLVTDTRCQYVMAVMAMAAGGEAKRSKAGGKLLQGWQGAKASLPSHESALGGLASLSARSPSFQSHHCMPLQKNTTLFFPHGPD